MVCGPGGPSSSSRTVLRKLLELEGDSQNSCSELLPTPLPQTQDGACLIKFLLAVSQLHSHQWTTKARTALVNLNHKVSCGSSTTTTTTSNTATQDLL